MGPEVYYWRGLALLAAGRAPEAETLVSAALKTLTRIPSVEFEWRMRAIGAAAARARGDLTGAQQMSAGAQTALAALRAAWKGDAEAYERRPDLVELKRAAGLS
jgi:hypothetical protein